MVNYFEQIQLQLLPFTLFGFIGFELLVWFFFLGITVHLEKPNTIFSSKKESLQVNFSGLDEVILLGH